MTDVQTCPACGCLRMDRPEAACPASDRLRELESRIARLEAALPKTDRLWRRCPLHPEHVCVAIAQQCTDLCAYGCAIDNGHPAPSEAG